MTNAAESVIISAVAVVEPLRLEPEAAVWKYEAYVEPRTVDVHIRRLRTAIEDNPAEPVFVKTKRGVGYYVE